MPAEVGVLLSDYEASLIFEIWKAYVVGHPFPADFDHDTANVALEKLQRGADRCQQA